jgi:hypothetical protein
MKKKHEDILKENGWKPSAYHEDTFLRKGKEISQTGNRTDFGTSSNYGISNTKLRDKSS